MKQWADDGPSKHNSFLPPASIAPANGKRQPRPAFFSEDQFELPVSCLKPGGLSSGWSGPERPGTRSGRSRELLPREHEVRGNGCRDDCGRRGGRCFERRCGPEWRTAAVETGKYHCDTSAPSF